MATGKEEQGSESPFVFRHLGGEMRKRLAFWANLIGVKAPKTYRIPLKEMVDWSDNRRPYSFNGYSPESDTIFYQGILTDDVIIHELLHKKFPKIQHKDIRTLTEIIFNSANSLPPLK